ncbi:membrane protein insertase YidC [Sciscionella marina]|uniref:membrane protein insertase YidC n=1 Tax=Sciscionella marina TaxID=508770 RepID=UPI00039DC12F|nr:membrane protein insertase YidC [Sciscionella marina]
MLDFIYWPVSFVMWCWHKVFGFILGDSNAFAWALSIVFLVFTLRALLLKPMVHQIKSMRKMQEFQPQIKALQKKYANDRQRQAQEMQKLQREHGFNPLGGCLPMIFQIPVFIGLNHVIRNFNPNYGSNYFFPKSDITSYLRADLFGVHLNDMVFNAGLLGSYGGGAHGFHWGVAPVAIPLMIVASIATHFTARLSVQRQQAMGTTNNQPGGAMMQKVQLYLFPLGVLIFGAALPIGLLLYWLSNNSWTLAQQHFVFRRMDKEEARKKQEAQEARQALAPKPGQKPGKQPANQPKEQDEPNAEKAPEPVEKNETKKSEKSGGEAKSDGGSPKQQPKEAPAGTTASNGSGGKGDSAQSKSNGALNTSQSVPGLISDRGRKKKRNRK